ncbi:MAG: NfeD family protein [Desulfovermiculus sp.]|nr:NfeD family protein [Desulfovermiculus sp.]
MDLFISPWLIWFLLGIGLAFLELFMPGLVIIFMALGCWIVTVTLLIWPLSLTQQVLIFIGGTVVSIVLLRTWFMKTFRGVASDKTQTGFDDFPQGVHVQVVKGISPNVNGRIKFRGTLWDAIADEEIEEGETVEIVSYAGDSRQIYFVRKIS